MKTKEFKMPAFGVWVFLMVLSLTGKEDKYFTFSCINYHVAYKSPIKICVT